MARRSTVDDADAPSSRLRGNEVTYAVVAGLVVVVSGVLLALNRTGKGVTGHPGVTYEVIAIVAGVALIATTQLRNRLIAASLALLGGFFIGQVHSPNAMAGVKTAGFLLPAAFALLVYIRQSRADRARRQADRAAGRDPSTSRGGRTGGKGAGAATVEQRQSRASGRYTPPKDRTPARKRGRR